MPKITFPKADLEALAGTGPLSLEDVDALVQLAKGELHLRQSTEEELRVELQDTNRPDTWCVEGIARLLRTHRSGEAPGYSFFAAVDAQTAGEIVVDPSVEGLRPYVAGFLARGYTVDGPGLEAFISAQEVLCRNFGRKRKSVAIGIYDASRLRFPVRYLAVPADDRRYAFVPLAPAQAQSEEGGAVKDAQGREIPASRWEEPWTPAQILADHPTGREYAAAVADPSRATLLVDARDEVLSFPPLINSRGLGRVTEGMSELFVEVTGTVLDHVLLAANILAANLADRGARIEPVVTRYPYDTPRGRVLRCPHPLEDKRTVRFRPADVERLLGVAPSPEEICARLGAFGVEARAEGEEVVATAPPYRADYLHAVDAIEDYAISAGLNGFEPVLPEAFTVGGLAAETAFADLVRDVAIGCGLEEAIGNLLTCEESVRGRMGLGALPEPNALHGGPPVRIANVMNQNYSVLRDWLLPTLLEVESNSSGALFPHRFFEVGEVCRWDGEENLKSRTEWGLVCAFADHEVGFSDAQAYLHQVLRLLGLDYVAAGERDAALAAQGASARIYSLLPGGHPSFLPGRAAWIWVPGSERCGLIGEIHPEVLERWKARAPVAAFELRLEPLRALLGRA